MQSTLSIYLNVSYVSCVSSRVLKNASERHARNLRRKSVLLHCAVICSGEKKTTENPSAGLCETYFNYLSFVMCIFETG